MQNQINNFLETARECRINATSVIYLGLKENQWIPKDELRTIIDKAVIFGQSKYAKGTSHYLRISKIPSQFDSAFEGVCSLFDMGAIKTDKEQPFGSKQIQNNIEKLKRKLGKNTTSLYQHLLLKVNETPVQELTWKDSLASQIFRDNAPIIDDLCKNQKTKGLHKAFMKPVREIKSTLLLSVKNRCKEFVSSFSDHNYSRFSSKFIHNKTWKESEKEILLVNNPALNSKTARALNEGTYHTSERESLVSADRKRDGQTERCPDIMFMLNDDIKLWRECNDGMYYTRKFLNPEKSQFGIVGIQIAGDTLHLNVLIRDTTNIHKYYNIEMVKIPVQKSDKTIVIKFVENLLFLRNILITNLSLLYHGSVCISERQKEGSTTIDSE
ncbi:15853_t:CDS:2 [Cetraspora pellucida]|uniref:15853_t:CDS:1 n=1 Tax=Cetraspora pellucida TaxID=1433469 RepID=A0A9N9ILK7_9GLOM|nr:15853_t:CDS:2 [Cetraspora pellucida]